MNHQIYGTTIFIGKLDIDTIYGKFQAYTFQDLIHKGYVIALSHGNINADIITTRMHSSCVTSETMQSMDCDCVSQLNGALKIISQTDGILFYLIQEGRGCGYVGKSRACMHVQYHENTKDEINTFQAYESLGMKHDYRDYTNVKDITHILNIDPEFILLTNNPDKIEKFQKLNLKLKEVKSIEITPNPFNQQYLMSKEKYGHILYQAKTKVQKYIIPHNKIEPFIPNSLNNCRRFVKVSSYYLPLKPINNQIILDESEINLLQKDTNIIFPRYPLEDNKYLIQVSDQLINKYDYLCKPWWFNINMFYDIVSHQDFLVLKYGDLNSDTVPKVRIHSESLFDRFPLKKRSYNFRYEKALEEIIKNGCGMIIILYNDGRGSGLGYYVLNKNSPNHIGVEQDKRDYIGAINLIKEFTNKPIDILHGNTSDKLIDVMKEENVNVRNFILMNDDSHKISNLSIRNRINHLPDIYDKVLEQKIDIDMEFFNKKIIITGIGSSESHGKYLESLLQNNFNVRFKSYDDIISDDKFDDIISDDKFDDIISNDNLDDINLIMFSQGINPNSEIILQKFSNILLISSYNFDDDKEIMKYLKTINANILSYPKEILDNTLIRITGPIIGYLMSDKIYNFVLKNNKPIENIFKQNIYENFNISNNFISNMKNNNNLFIILDSKTKKYSKNIKNKFIEGTFSNVIITDYIEFCHGYYQMLSHQKNNENIYSIITIEDNNKFYKNTMELIKDYPKLDIYTNNIIMIERILNNIVIDLIDDMGIDQVNWIGKQEQKKCYDIKK
jgi:3,4-dihydroxy 2-butanone 4-phosphate synthase/GTP cyclohydrolase II